MSSPRLQAFLCLINSPPIQFVFGKGIPLPHSNQGSNCKLRPINRPMEDRHRLPKLGRHVNSHLGLGRDSIYRTQSHGKNDSRVAQRGHRTCKNASGKSASRSSTPEPERRPSRPREPLLSPARSRGPEDLLPSIDSLRKDPDPLGRALPIALSSTSFISATTRACRAETPFTL